MSGALAILLGVLVIFDPERVKPTNVPSAAEETVDGGQVGSEAPPSTAGRAEEMSITSQRSDFDRGEGVSMFEGNVCVEYKPSYTLVADRLYAFFRGSNELDRIVAMGHVAITNETRVGTCDSAIFRRLAREIELRGATDGTPAKLEEVGKDAVYGRAIRFWLETEQVEVKGSTLKVAPGKVDVRKQL